MALDYKELKEKYPKALGELEKFAKISLEAMQKLMLEDLKKHGEIDFELPEVTPDLVEDIVKNLLSSTSIRQLYDFFDGYTIFITVDFIDSHWDWTISTSNKSGTGAVDLHKNRTDAENQAFGEGFKVLEEQL